MPKRKLRWTVAQRAKFMATMARKKTEANGVASNDTVVELLSSKRAATIDSLVREGIALFNGENSLDEVATYITAKIIVALVETD